MDLISRGRAVQAVANVLSDAGVTMAASWEVGVMRKANKLTRINIVSAYRRIYGDDVEVTVNFNQLGDYCHDAYALLYGNAFDDIEALIGAEVESALWSIQNERPCDSTAYKMQRDMKGAA